MSMTISIVHLKGSLMLLDLVNYLIFSTSYRLTLACSNQSKTSFFYYAYFCNILQEIYVNFAFLYCQYVVTVLKESPHSFARNCSSKYNSQRTQIPCTWSVLVPAKNQVHLQGVLFEERFQHQERLSYRSQCLVQLSDDVCSWGKHLLALKLVVLSFWSLSIRRTLRRKVIAVG